MTEKLSDQELNDMLTADCPEFTAWAHTMPPKYWARYDISACKLGWAACRKRMALKDCGPKEDGG